MKGLVLALVAALFLVPAALAAPQRIVSLSPTATEDLFAIGAGKQVIAVDNDPVDSSLSLVANIRERSVGDKVSLTVLRDGKRVDLTTTLVAKAAATS